ncbi:MAG: hypothetical protein QW727_02560 [Candidatus Pacearchaeota archaeon]
MDKNKIILIFFMSVFILFFLTMFVSGAGSSTSSVSSSGGSARIEVREQQFRDSSRNRTGLEVALDASQNRSERARQVLTQLIACESLTNRTERIECRLRIRDKENYKNETERVLTEEAKIPEACRRLNTENKTLCKQLHRASNICYDLEGRQKNKCFKRVIGFINSNLNDEPSRVERAEKGRKYIILLLYDLQEKIEKKVSDGEISENTGANLISQITEIKENILNNEPRRVIQPKIQAFRQSFREAIQ